MAYFCLDLRLLYDLITELKMKPMPCYRAILKNIYGNYKEIKRKAISVTVTVETASVTPVVALELVGWTV